VSDLVLRLPGASLGTERECEFARTRQIPVVGAAYFSCLKELFPEEHRQTYTRADMSNLLRYNRQRRRDAGLPAMSEDEAAFWEPAVESFHAC
jgi:hypothetical protein